jgi:hypothetical protein
MRTGNNNNYVTLRALPTSWAALKSMVEFEAPRIRPGILDDGKRAALERIGRAITATTARAGLSLALHYSIYQYIKFIFFSPPASLSTGILVRVV